MNAGFLLAAARRRAGGWRWLGLVAALLAATPGCRQDMVSQPRYEPLGHSDFYPDGRMSREPPAQTVARGELNDDDHFYKGEVGGKLVTTFPQPVTREMLLAGRELYQIHCTECHGASGAGNGMVVQRGFPHPPALASDSLREAPVGHFYDVITHGYGVMAPYASRITPDERWEIIAYVRALQLSQHANVADADPAELPKLQAADNP